MMAPQIARPAPHTAARSVRGRRSSHTMPSRMRETPASPQPEVLGDDAEHVAHRHAAGPIVIAKATDSASAARPTAQSAPRAPRTVAACTTWLNA